MNVIIPQHQNRVATLLLCYKPPWPVLIISVLPPLLSAAIIGGFCQIIITKQTYKNYISTLYPATVFIPAFIYLFVPGGYTCTHTHRHTDTHTDTHKHTHKHTEILSLKRFHTDKHRKTTESEKKWLF